MRTRSRTREEETWSEDVQSLVRRCESALREIRSDLEREKRAVTELSAKFVSSREERERATRVASELGETCRALSAENERLETVVATRDAQIARERAKWTETRDELAANAKSLCLTIEKQTTENRRLQATLATTNETLRAKNEELVASYEVHARTENARATLEIQARDLMRNNADLTAILFQPRT